MSISLSADLYVFDRRQKYHQLSQEIRASGDLFTGFDYVAGAYYFKSKYHLIQNTRVFAAPAPTQDTTGRSESYAGFIDFNWEIFDRVRLSGGGRYTHDKKSLESSLQGVFSIPRTSKSWSKFTPKVSVDYRPTDDLMVYASWSRGYRSGGFNGRGQSVFSASTPYDPETVDAYEVGFKSEFLDRRVALNVAAFYTDYKKIQQSTTVQIPVAPFNETVVANAAAAKIKGIEADLTVKPMEDFTIRGSFGYTDSKFKGFIINQPTFGAIRQFDLSDVDLIYAPKITASIGGEYSLPISFGQVKLNAQYRYLSRYDQQIAADPATPIPVTGLIVASRNDPRVRSDVQHLVDASLTVLFDMNDQGAQGRVSVFGRNLLDDRGTVTAFTVGAFPTLWAFAAAREPRTYGVQVGFEF